MEHFLFLGLGIVPRPGMLSILANHPQLGSPEQIYSSYPASSAFQPLGQRGEAKAGAGPLTQGQLHQMHLEWLARAGMFYAGPRLQDLTGQSCVHLSSSPGPGV